MSLERSTIIKSVNTPLGFFALSLLTGEVFLGIVLIYSDLGRLEKYIGMLLGAGMFASVVIVVAIFVWRFPENLTYSGKEHLKNNFGSTGKEMSKNELEKQEKVEPEIELKKST